MTTPTVTRQDAGHGRSTYRLTGTVNGEAYDGQVVIAASTVAYTHAALTTLTDGQQVLSFHKSAAAAARGNPQIARRYHAGVTVIDI
jgi:hypothetical protein